MKNARFLSVILTAVLCISGDVLAYSGGDGSAGNPYQIANVADFQQLSNTPTDWYLSFILTENIDLIGLTFAQAPIAPGTIIDLDGVFQGPKFTGIFDGNEHTISNLTINASTKAYIGLFGYVGSDGQISNLRIEGTVITGLAYVGGLVGYNSGTIISCQVTGSVNGTAQYSCNGGGLVGRNNSGTLTDCYASGSVSGSEDIGGLVGVNSSGTLIRCHATGSISGTGRLGGLVGYNDGVSITQCYATGSVTGSSSGGLVGQNWRPLTNCYATGSVSGNSDIGGLVGSNIGSSATITNCYATGSATGTGKYNYYIGGLVGNTGGSITGCYATGLVSGYNYVGGLVGANYSGISACFWDIQTSGKTVGIGYGTSTGVTGKTTTQMKTLSTFTSPPASWDFSVTDGDPADWMMLRPGEDYPRLAWQPIIAGDIAGLYGVNSVDYAEIAAHWGQTGCPTGCENADINNDGTVDITDLMLLADNWLEGT
jgi:hypothetical protein